MKSPHHNGQNTTSDTQAFPPPTAEERACSSELVLRIREEIVKEGGEIPFDRFMELALYAPGLGYYAAGRDKFGERGDFITAPEMGSLFARCLARSCRSILEELQDGDILEFGAGSGVLAADLLGELEAMAELPTRYLILELSAELRARQVETLRQKVPRLLSRVHWLDAWPVDFSGIVIANEVLDAMPAQRFHVTPHGINLFHVTWDHDCFVWHEKPADATIEARIETLALGPDYRSEINLRAEAWVNSVAETLTRGALLLIDYGFPRAEFYHPQRNQGTLMCHYCHRAHDDPLRFVGLQDICTHVDFTGIAEAGKGAGLALLGYTSQAAFLINSGLDNVVAVSDPLDVRNHLALTAQIKKLTSPHEMGELYKVMTLGRGLHEPMIGFSAHDRRGRL